MSRCGRETLSRGPVSWFNHDEYEGLLGSPVILLVGVAVPSLSLLRQT